MGSKKSKRSSGNTVPVLRQAIRVLVAVAQSPGDATTKSLAASLSISPSTCYRILQSFVVEGWLRTKVGGTFELSFGLVPLLRPLLRHEMLIETVREPIARLAKTTGLTAKLTIRQGNDAVTISSAQSPRSHAIASRVGAVVSLAYGSSGACFLAALPDSEVQRILDDAPPEAWKFQTRRNAIDRITEVRKLGCAYDDGSYQTHLHTLSAPIYTHNKEVMGVITLLGFPQDFDGTNKSAMMSELKFTAGGCSQLIQGNVSASA